MLIFTGALWWIARRDLAARAVPPPPMAVAEMADLEQLCATLETVVTDLARRLDALERGVPVSVPPRLSEAPAERGGDLLAAAPFVSAPSAPAVSALAPRPAPEADPRHQPVFALLAQGVTDPAEIARQTGLGRGEVDLILSLHARRAF